MPAMAPADRSPIHLAFDGPVARLLIDRPERRNALTTAMWQALDSAIEAIESSPARAVLLSGSGGHFSAGADIAELEAQLSDPAALRANAALVQRVQQRLTRLRRPKLALIRGACVGGGVGLALCCDLRLASADARFALTPIRLGLHYSLADTRRLAAVVGLARAREMLMTAATLDAVTVASWGLVNRVLEDETRLAEEADRIAASWSRASPDALAATQRVLAALDGSEALDEAELQSQFEAAFSGPDFAEGAAAFLAKRSPRFGTPPDEQESSA